MQGNLELLVHLLILYKVYVFMYGVLIHYIHTCIHTYIRKYIHTHTYIQAMNITLANLYVSEVRC